jgi:hypothetical protein
MREGFETKIDVISKLRYFGMLKSISLVCE